MVHSYIKRYKIVHNVAITFLHAAVLQHHQSFYICIASLVVLILASLTLAGSDFTFSHMDKIIQNLSSSDVVILPEHVELVQSGHIAVQTEPDLYSFFSSTSIQRCLFSVSISYLYIIKITVTFFRRTEHHIY